MSFAACLCLALAAPAPPARPLPALATFRDDGGPSVLREVVVDAEARTLWRGTVPYRLRCPPGVMAVLGAAARARVRVEIDGLPDGPFYEVLSVRVE